MSTVLPPIVPGKVLLTLEEFLAIVPEEKVERDLIRGELKERPMTKRNRFHAKAEASVTYVLKAWLISQPEPKGELYSGEVGCILRHDPPSSVGIDVAYFSAEAVAAQTDATSLVDGVPLLAVEILSPSDKHEDIVAKIDLYLEVGVAVIWVLDPDFKTVTVYGNGAEPQLFNLNQSIAESPFLPGLNLPVKELFA